FFYKLIIFFALPFIVVFVDKTYHKIKDGLFITTPYSFVNSSASAFYVSKISDSTLIENEDYKAIFIKCHNHLAENNLLLVTQKKSSFEKYYKHFHNHIPQICNQTIHNFSRKYYLEKDANNIKDPKFADATSYLNAEITVKSLFFTLVKQNLKDWLHLYYENLKNAFYGLPLLLFIVCIFIFSSIKLLFSKDKSQQFIFLFSALTLSNALIVCFASHSIMRYLFYNYSLIFLIFVILINKIVYARKT